jgi:hypothetical protein
MYLSLLDWRIFLHESNDSGTRTCSRRSLLKNDKLRSGLNENLKPYNLFTWLGKTTLFENLHRDPMLVLLFRNNVCVGCMTDEAVKLSI